MYINNTEIIDTFAEAFKMWGSRVIITAVSPQWAMHAAQSITGFATSIIGCKCEAGIEAELSPDQTLDGRPGVSVLFFTVKAEDMGKRLLERVGQCVLTCPTTACFNGLDAEQTVIVGGQLRFFGDGYQISKVLAGRRFWRIPVMEGEFLVDERFGVQPAIGGGNILILGRDMPTTLQATEAAVAAMRTVPGVILPFPGGVVRSGSKTRSRYKGLFASTNDAYCPTLRGIAPETQVPPEAGCVLEIVIDGLDLPAVEEATRRGILAAAESGGALQISAGNYGGTLGQYQIKLHEVLNGQSVSLS
ncbi:MAG: formylmethanofuran--tetrahydromethanopterin N-formyltransferase [Anaerolineae bacterium]